LKKSAPDVLKAMLALQDSVERCGLEVSLLELIKMRASQMNGCAYCLDMHTKDARALGETEQRLFVLSAWRETPFYSERERAALSWTEALTDITRNHVPGDEYHRALAHFTEPELAQLSLAIVTINAWNRLATAFRFPVGNHQPLAHVSPDSG
jgi:AhpD family alkylhydroperoxidase